ncbi:MAG: glucose-1-phosphate thymidylyltransferase RfbA, partial [Patescibacteria group bacterium]
GGSGPRLYPLTIGISKQLLPVVDKPMIYYPRATLFLLGFREILIITTPEDQLAFKRLLGDGSKWGLVFKYVVQPKPEGIAQAFILGESFIGNDPVTLILGDNIFCGIEEEFRPDRHPEGAIVFGIEVADPERYGVIEFDELGRVFGIEEKPRHPRSNFVVPGLYIYENNVVSITKMIRPSGRGELEITAVNQEYLKEEKLNVIQLSRNTDWFDAGTFASLKESGDWIEAIQNRKGYCIACIEEIVWRLGYINDEELRELATPMTKNSYGQYLMSLTNRK